MSTLDRYIAGIFIRNLLLVLVTLVALYGMIEFLDKIDDFIEFQAGLKFYLLYPFYFLPVIVSNSLPMAVLLATFATIGGLSRSSQLTAMLSGGISFMQISRPLFLSGLVLAFMVMIANLWLVPWASLETHYLLNTEIKGETTETTVNKDLYFRDGTRIISVSHAFPAKRVVQGLNVVEFNDDFMPIKRVQASMATHVIAGQWRLKNAVIWEFTPGTRSVSSYDQQAEMVMDLKREPDKMLQLWNRPEDLTIGELFRVTAKLSAEGYDPKSYQVEAHMRFAKAAIPLIMVLVGIPFALQRGRNTSFSLGVVISLVIFAVYFLLYACFAVFGAVNILPPLVSAWAANLLMALLGSWFFLRLDG